ncbi:triadin isoform X3 [Helicoverpa armigera]|uniref:triadin isoform X3 n=1 Tax=Helicoverpa armigera TaxID=29058 RepID=UPI0030835046
MSQKVSRKTAVSEEKEKSNSPVKEMKKKMAANAEKEKQAAEKVTDKPADKTEKPVEKVAEKPAEKPEKNDKPDKGGDKKAEKQDKAVDKKAAEKPDKSADKKQSKEEAKKNEPQPEKSKADASKEDKTAKPAEKSDAKKPEPTKTKQNGRGLAHNGVSDVTLGTNGTDDVLNGTVKATRTPETPRPASDKPDKEADEPKDKLLKLKEDTAPPTDRRLRSSNSPKPQEGKKPETKKDSPKKSQDGLEKVDEKDEDAAKEDKEKDDVVEVTLEVPSNEGEESRKPDTNFSKSRVKVSPYRRSMRLADQTNTSLQANYTGNNTTMEMDITETSSFLEDAPLDDSSYLRGLRSIRGRSSYKQLKEITLKHVAANRSVRSNAGAVTSPLSDATSRPTGTVVGRKRKPEHDDVEQATEATEHGASKRMRVLDRLAQPFRRATVQRRNAPIVGINTDLPLCAPVASPEPFDPECLKASTSTPAAPAPAPTDPIAVPLAPTQDNKRCVIM